MTTLDTSAAATTNDGRALVADDTTGVFDSMSGWLTTTDHKRIGRLFVVSSLVVGVAVALVAVVLGIERVADGEVFDASAVPQLFAAFRFGLVYSLALPLMVGVAIAVVPLQVGARALAFPRLALTGFWCWASGLVFIAIALANNGGPAGGDADMVDLFLAAFALQLIGLLAAGVSVATTVLTARVPGMTLRRIPLFSWSALVQAIAITLTLPLQIGLVVYLFVDHRNGRLAFGGNTGIGQWLGYGVTQPMTYVAAIGVFGLALELIAVTFGRRLQLRSVLYAGVGLVGVGALGAVTQQTRNFEVLWRTAGAPDDAAETLGDIVTLGLFLGLPLLGALTVLGAGGLTAAAAAAAKVRPRISGPFVMSFLGAGMVVTGMVGGLVYPIGIFGLSGTVFEEACLVYVVYGTVLAGMGAVAYWSPKWWGRLIPDKQVLGLGALGMIATVLASLPYVVAGFADQPAGAVEFDYEGPKVLWNLAVTAGHALMAVVVLGFVGLVAKTAAGRGGDEAPDDPWGGQTLEWATASPAPRDNFAVVGSVMSPEPLIDSTAEPDEEAR